MKKAFILTHLGLGDNISCNGIVNYISNIYDKVVVVCKIKYENNVKLLYSDNDKVSLFKVIDDSNISPNKNLSNSYITNIEIIRKISDEFDLYLVGGHILSNDYSLLPFNFYRDLNIPNDVFWLYSNIPYIENSNELYNIIVHNNIENYIVIHNNASTGNVFNNILVETHSGKSKEEILYINLNENIYDKTHKFYNIAQEFVSKPLLYYTSIIKNATYIYLADSSIFCMSIHLNITTDNCYYISRSNIDYSYLYSIENITEETLDFIKKNRRFFKQLKI
jgi:hypothetical protein